MPPFVRTWAHLDRKGPYAALSRHGAFALIGLLVVTSIISLLVALVLPVLQAARRQVRVMQCFSGRRQVGLGASMYVGDRKGYMPRPSSAPALGITWSRTLSRGGWIGSEIGLRCPDGLPRHPSEYEPAMSSARFLLASGMGFLDGSARRLNVRDLDVIRPAIGSIRRLSIQAYDRRSRAAGSWVANG